MTSLNLAGNTIGGSYIGFKGFVATPEGVISLCCICHTSLFLSLLVSGPAAIADAIKNMGALTKLDISNNYIEQGQALQQITKCCNTKGVELNSHQPYL
jgi:hypothetical protein